MPIIISENVIFSYIVHLSSFNFDQHTGTKCMVCHDVDLSEATFPPGHGYSGQSYRATRDLNSVFKQAGNTFAVSFGTPSPSDRSHSRGGASPRPMTARSRASVDRPRTAFSETTSNGYYGHVPRSACSTSRADHTNRVDHVIRNDTQGAHRDGTTEDVVAPPAQMETNNFPSRRRMPRASSPRKECKLKTNTNTPDRSIPSAGRQVVRRENNARLLAAGSSLTPRASPEQFENEEDKLQYETIAQAKAVMRAWHAGDPRLALAGQRQPQPLTNHKPIWICMIIVRIVEFEFTF